MASIGKVQASALTASQETTLALVSINADFSLAKIEAPSEYQGISNALTRPRRIAAEVGPSHVLARRLGTLFRGILPSVPSLIAAYGKRATEISQSLDARVTKARFGAFHEHVGVDVTSLWAAATSGTSAVAAHLLACLLARAWKAPEAVAIWRELVDERKSRLRQNIDIAPDEAACVLQEILDKDLEQWDASARAWLATADDSSPFQRQQSQIKVILTGLDIKIDHSSDVYNSVTRAWTGALEVMDKIVSGANYSVQNGAILLALSSWHIYPDLILLREQSQRIEQHDCLVAVSGAVTIGLELSQNHPDKAKGVYWTLSLAHLRYYGPHVQVQSEITTARDRVSLDDFVFVVFGALFEIIDGRRERLSQTMSLFVILDEESTSLESLTGGSSSIKGYSSWLCLMRQASIMYLESDNEDRSQKDRALALGRRRKACLLRGLPKKRESLRMTTMGSLLKFSKQIQLPQRIPFLLTLFRMAQLKGTVLIIVDDLGHDSIIVLDLGENPQDPLKVFVNVVPDPSHQADRRSRMQKYLPGSLVQDAPPGQFSKISLSGIFVWEDFSPPHLQTEPTNTKGFQGIFRVKKTRSRAIEPAPKRESFCTYEYRVIHSTEPEEFRGFRPTTGASIYGNQQFYKTYDAAIEIDVQPFIELIRNNPELRSEYAKSLYNFEFFNTGRGSYFHELPLLEDHLAKSLMAFAAAHHVHKAMGTTTVSLQCLHHAIPWYGYDWVRHLEAVAKGKGLSRGQALACICQFETGYMNLDPGTLDTAMGLFFEGYLYIPSSMLQDPTRDVGDAATITKVMGSIGLPGLVILQSPTVQLQLRGVDADKWQVINHLPFDGLIEDNFKSSSLHLTFTGHSLPLSTGRSSGKLVDAAVHETVVALHDHGEWVADLDCLSAASDLQELLAKIPGWVWKRAKSCVEVAKVQSDCAHDRSAPPSEFLVSIDNWEELLDPPNESAVIRTKGNWQARLAALSIVGRPGRSLDTGEHVDESENVESLPPWGAVLFETAVGVCWECALLSPERQAKLGWEKVLYIL